MIPMRLVLASLAVCGAFRPGFAPRRAHARRSPVTLMSTVTSTEITMPALSSTMTEGTISEWLKSVGDKVEVGDAVMVVASDKADMDVESFEEGYLAAVLVGEGETATVGAPVALLAREPGWTHSLQKRAPTQREPPRHEGAPQIPCLQDQPTRCLPACSKWWSEDQYQRILVAWSADAGAPQHDRRAGCCRKECGAAWAGRQ